jgi:hypothetical protein
MNSQFFENDCFFVIVGCESCKGNQNGYEVLFTPAAPLTVVVINFSCLKNELLWEHFLNQN